MGAKFGAKMGLTDSIGFEIFNLDCVKIARETQVPKIDFITFLFFSLRFGMKSWIRENYILQQKQAKLAQRFSSPGKDFVLHSLKITLGIDIQYSPTY